MDKAGRKAAVAAFKERKSAPGVYAVRCGPSGQVWVGRTLNLEAIRNRVWFSLRQNNHPERSLQEAWAAHGPDGFTLETLEQLEEEELAYVREARLKARLAHWRAALNALPLS